MLFFPIDCGLEEPAWGRNLRPIGTFRWAMWGDESLAANVSQDVHGAVSQWHKVWLANRQRDRSVRGSTSEREISSRSASVNASLEWCRHAGRIQTVSARNASTDG